MPLPRLGRGSMGGTPSLALPLGKGPHHVGCTDVMVGHTRQVRGRGSMHSRAAAASWVLQELSSPRTPPPPLCAVPTVSPPPFPSLPQGLFLRLFYPCLPRAGAERPLWIPRYEYCGGLADFAHRSRRWCAPLLNVTIGKGGSQHPVPHPGCSPVPWAPAPLAAFEDTKPIPRAEPLPVSPIFSWGVSLPHRLLQSARELERTFQALQQRVPTDHLLPRPGSLSVG